VSSTLAFFSVRENNMAFNMDQAVRPRTELLLLTENQKRTIRRQEEIIERQYVMIQQQREEIERLHRRMDAQRQEMAEMQVENICILGENSALERRKKETSTQGTCSQ